MSNLKSAKNLSGIYRARVEDNKDPMKIGRVRVRVPLLHGLPDKGVPKGSLPWAYPSFNSAGYGYGTYIVPEVGEYVFIIFEDEDPYKPVYIGSSYGSGSKSNKAYGSKDNQGVWYGVPGRNEVPVEAQKTYPNKKIIYKSPKGASVEIDETDGHENLSLIDALGQCVKLESELVGGVTHKRNSKDASDGEIDTGLYRVAKVSILGASGQKLILNSSETDNYISIEAGDTVIKVESNNEVSISNNAYNITIDKDGKMSIQDIKSINVKTDDVTIEGNVTIIENVQSN